MLSINNPKFGNYIVDIYPAELEIKDTTDADHLASYLDLDLSYDRDKRLEVKLYDKRDDFNFNIVNFPFLSSNIPQSPAYVCMFHNLYVTLVHPLLIVIFWLEVAFCLLNY